ncbi:MAG TPA: nitrile hydratase accessory protein [Gammaproteobacteria bacterium]|nr:nitrile hydratase accessory protein [Gammaproteobacteria bacterium]
MSTDQRKPPQPGTGHGLIDAPDATPESLLRGVNELAGVSGQDPNVIPQDSGPLFLAPWEAKVFAMIVFLNREGHFSWAEWVDFFKTEIDDATAARKQTHGPAYYLLWLTAAEKLLATKGLLVEEEYSRAKSAFALDHPHPCIRGLMQEHEAIHEVLDAFAAFVQRLENDDGTPAELLAFVDFFTAFVEQFHHGKEEDLLFQAMTAHGFPEDGPIAVMRDEHLQGGRYATELRASAETAWGRRDKAEAAQTGQRYIQLLRQHVMKEDADLYPSAHARLGEAILTDLDRACGDYDRAHAQERERLLACADSLTGH